MIRCKAANYLLKQSNDLKVVSKLLVLRLSPLIKGDLFLFFLNPQVK